MSDIKPASYFQLHIDPIPGASSGVVIVDNFHPRWQEAAQWLMKGNLVKIMESHSQKVSEWTKVPINLDFSKEFGLMHIALPARAAIDLQLQGINSPRYVSHNINGVDYTMAAVAAMTGYIHWMNFMLNDLESKDSKPCD